jgi:hypothetical protein
MLEQLTILKGGASLITGNNVNGCHWGRLLLNYLLVCTLKNSKFQTVVIVCVDIRVSEVFRLLKISSLDHFLENGRVILMGSFQEFQMSLESSESKRFTEDEASAVFLYSLNEIFSTGGDKRKNIDFVRNLIQYSNEEIRSHAPLSTNGSKYPSLFLTYLEVSSFIEAAYYQAMFPTNLIMIPNDGTISSKVCCQVQIIRQSSSSKIQEFIEMFGFQKPGILLEIIPSKVERSASAKKEPDLIQPAVLPPHSASRTISNQESQSVVNTRFIAFESTDPEFDEDSDPDADLDL